MITILATMLGTVVPLLFVFTLAKGIERSGFDKSKTWNYKIRLIAIGLIWTLVIWLSGMAGTFSYHEGDMIPRFVLPLLIPVMIGLVSLRNQDFRTIVDNTPLSLMVGMQTFRLMGVLFILVVNAGLAPSSFISGGYGDIITGLLALLSGVMLKNNASGAKNVTWMFMVAGVADLLNVAFQLLFYYPIWSNVQPSSAGAAEFPLILVLGLAAPIALTFHLYTLRKLIFASQISEA